MKKERHEVIMAGSGGQGLVVSGIMLAEAAIIEGKNVVQTVSYGIATRGGFSMAEVIIDREEIIFQQVQNADIVLALTEEAMEKFQSLADSGAEIFYDTTLLKERRGEHLYGHPFTDMASRIGHVGMANIIALGCMAKMHWDGGDPEPCRGHREAFFRKNPGAEHRSPGGGYRACGPINQGFIFRAACPAATLPEQWRELIRGQRSGNG